MITMCNKENRSALMLTPTHGKHVYALAVITAVHGNTLYAENVETLQLVDKENLAKAIRQEMTLVTQLLQHTSVNKGAEWNETTYPLVSARCRALGRSPTGPELDSLNIHASKTHAYIVTSAFRLHGIIKQRNMSITYGFPSAW